MAGLQYCLYYYLTIIFLIMISMYYSYIFICYNLLCLLALYIIKPLKITLIHARKTYSNIRKLNIFFYIFTYEKYPLSWKSNFKRKSCKIVINKKKKRFS